MSSARWYVSETLPRSELRAQGHLERQGFSSFCPRFRKTRRHARRIEQILAPLFPGYVFVRFDPEHDPWHAINGTLGVRRLVGQSTVRPQPMPEAAMKALFARCEAEVVSSVLPDFVPGHQVRLLSGAFVDRLATVEHLDDRGRVSVLLEILGARRSLRVKPGDLAPA